MMEGLLAWIPEIDSSRPRFWRDCLTVRDPRVSLVTKKTGQVSLAQLNPHGHNPLGDSIHGLLAKPLGYHDLEMRHPIHA